tara:strand:+ start:148 stop:375 length:228 start_codon:yes stop_codon:yes gene_type:complete
MHNAHPKFAKALTVLNSLLAKIVDSFWLKQATGFSHGRRLDITYFFGSIQFNIQFTTTDTVTLPRSIQPIYRNFG